MRDRELLTEQVLAVVETIPPGRVMSYGAIARVVGAIGPRQVGQVMAFEGGGVPWWRVVRADGTLPANLAKRAAENYRRERTPMRVDGVGVHMPAAQWAPELPRPPASASASS